MPLSPFARPDTAKAATPADAAAPARPARRRIRLEYAPNPTKGGCACRRGYLASNYSDSY